MEEQSHKNSRLSSISEGASYEKVPDTDDTILKEFKIKYQKSLEAIQSLQEILELKKTYGSISHTYDAFREHASNNVSYNAKKETRKLMKASKGETRIDPIYRLNLGTWNNLPKDIADDHTPQALEKQSPLVDRSRKAFRIKGKTSRGSSSLLNLKAATESNSQDNFNLKSLELAELLSKDGTMKPHSDPLQEKGDKGEDDEVLINPNTLRASYFTNPDPKELEINQSDPHAIKQIDRIMGEPYIRIKIKNLSNFKAEPLEQYDIETLYDQDPAKLLKEGIDRGFSRFANEKGDLEWRPCEIVEYLEEEKKFLIRWRHDGTLKKVTRLNLMFAIEQEDKFEHRLLEALENRYKQLYRESYEVMLSEKSKKEEGLNYPMKTLKNVVNLAFNRVPNLDELTTPYRLVDEMLDHYRKEVIRFSLEAENYQSGFNSFLNKVTDAYNEKRESSMKNQDKAIEVINIPKAELANFHDGVVPINQEIMTYELSELNHPESVKKYLEGIVKYSEHCYQWSAETTIQLMEKLNFQNIFLIGDIKLFRNRANSPAIPTPEGKDSPVTLIDSTPLSKERALIKRNILLANVARVKAEHELMIDKKKMDNRDRDRGLKDYKSYAITAFTREITKILPKPPDIIHHFLLMVSTSLKNLSEIKMFRSMVEYRKEYCINSIEDLESIGAAFKTDSSKIELFTYRVEKSIEELKQDIKYLKNEAIEHETLSRVIHFSNTMVQSCLKTCLKESLAQLLDDLEEYYAVLPFPTINQEIVSLLPDHIYQRRVLNREKLTLPEENFQPSKLKLQNIVSGPLGGINLLRMDKELIRAVTLYILDQINDTSTNTQLFRSGFKNFETARLRPLFNIKYVLKKSEKKKKKYKNREEREKQRRFCRENLYNYREFPERLVNEYSENKDVDHASPKNNTDFTTVTKGLLGWFRIKDYVASHKPNIFDIEDQLKKSIMMAFEVLPSLEKVDLSTFKTANFVTTVGIQEDLLKFRSRLDDLIKMATIPLFAILNILQNYDFLILQEDDYISDFKATDVGLICEEMETLQEELEHICTKIPKLFDLGLIKLDVSDYLEKLKSNIEIYINQFKKMLEQMLTELLNDAKKSVEETLHNLKKGADNIEDYIDLKSYLEETQWKTVEEKLQDELTRSHEIAESLEKYLIEYDENTMMIYFESKGWMKTLAKAKRIADVKLEEARPRLIKEQKQKTEELFRKLEKLKIAINSFANYYDISKAFDYWNEAMGINHDLDELERDSKKYNSYEDQLIYPRTDFSEIGRQKESFAKYYHLWEFIYYKWQSKKVLWLESIMDTIDLKGMEDSINSGLGILSELEDKFKNNINIVQIIQDHLREVNRFNELLKILSMLKHFKSHHWELLWEEMYGVLPNKPDHKTIRLEKVDHLLLSRAPVIAKIYEDAKKESNIEKEIEEMLRALNQISINVGAYTIGDSVGFYTIKGIPNLIPKLNDSMAKVSDMLSNPNYPKNLHDMLMNFDHAIKQTKKLLEMIDHIQKKLYRLAPIMRSRDISTLIKADNVHAFHHLKEVYRDLLEGVAKKRKLMYFFNLFGVGIDSERVDAERVDEVNQNGEEVLNKMKSILTQCDDIMDGFSVVLKNTRIRCPRLHLITDAQVLDLLTLQVEPHELIPHLTWMFPGVKSFKVEGEVHSYYIDGCTATDGQYISFHTKVPIELDNDKSNFFICKVINQVEKEIKRCIKDNLRYCFPFMLSNAYDYLSNFKLMSTKKLLFQLLLLMNDIVFYHDLTMIIATKEYANPDQKHSYIEDRLDLFKENIQENLKKFCENQEFLRAEKLKYLLMSQFIFQIKHHVDIIDYIYNSNTQSLDSFEYLVLPKMMLEYDLKAVLTKKPDLMTATLGKAKIVLDQLSTVQEYKFLNTSCDYMHFHTSLEPSQYGIILKSFNYRKNYGYDLVPFYFPLAYTPTTQRCFLSILGALSTHTGAIVNGLQDIGKKETIKNLANTLGKEIFIIDPYIATYDHLTQLVFGAVKHGFWVMCQGIQDYSFALLSTMAQHIFLIRNSLATGKSTIQYGSTLYEVKSEADWAIFATHSLRENKSSKSLENIPRNFTESFRVINYVNPHLSKILTLYFEAFQIPEPQKNAERVVTFLQIVTNAVDNQVFFQQHTVYEDLQILEAIHVKPSMSLIKKLVKHLQRRMTRNQNLEFSFSLLWEAIQIAFSGIIHTRAVPLVKKLFCNVFETEIEDLGGDEKIREKFQELYIQALDGYSVAEFQEFYDKCYELFEIIVNSTHRLKTIVISGSPGSGKSTLITAVAKLITLYFQKNFYVTWLDIDSCDPEFLLGGKLNPKQLRLQGILPILIEIAAQDITSTQLKEKDYANLFSIWHSKKANPEPDMPVTRSLDWVILEGVYDQKFKENVKVLDRIFAASKTGYLTSFDGLHTKIPVGMNFIIKVDKIKNLSPGNVADLALITMDETILNLDHVYMTKMDKLASSAEFFRNNMNLLNNLYKNLIYPVINFASSESEQKKMVYFISKKYMLSNFLSYFEIFLNECRKVEISYGNVNDNDVETFNRVIKENKKQLGLTRKRSSFSSTGEEGSASRKYSTTQQDLNMINRMPGLSEKISHLPDRQITMIESACIFCLIWTVGINYRPDNRKLFSRTLLDKVKAYFRTCKTVDTVSDYSFLNIFKVTQGREKEYSKLGIFDYCFDTRQQKWIPWKDLTIPSHQVISSSFHEIYIDHKEKCRFNPNLDPSPYKKKRFFDKNDFTHWFPDNENYIFFETDLSKKVMYFMDYMLAYKKPMLIVSEPENGKTSIIKHKIRLCLDGTNIRPFYYSITPFTTRAKLTKMIEQSLSRGEKGKYTPPKYNDETCEGYIFIDDIHLSSVEHKPWSLIKAFHTNKGWFCSTNQIFMCLDNISMISSSSHAFLSSENVFEDRLCNLPNMFLQKMNIFYAPEMSGRDFKSIFTQYTKDIMEEVQDQKYHRLLYRFEKLFARFIFRNKNNLQTISHIFGCNFGLKIAFQFFNSLRLWDWKEDIAPQTLIDIWFYNLKQTYGNQFPQLNKLPEQFLLEIGYENNLEIDKMSLSQGSSKSGSDSGLGSDNEEADGQVNASGSPSRKAKKQQTLLFKDPRRDDRINETLKRRSRQAIVSLETIDDEQISAASLTRKSLLNIMDLGNSAGQGSHQSIKEENKEETQEEKKDDEATTKNKNIPLIVIKSTSDQPPEGQSRKASEENLGKADKPPEKNIEINPFQEQEQNEGSPKEVAVSELDAESPGHKPENIQEDPIIVMEQPKEDNDAPIHPPKINLGLVPQIDSEPGSQNNSKENTPNDSKDSEGPSSLQSSPGQGFARRIRKSKTSLDAQTGSLLLHNLEIKIDDHKFEEPHPRLSKIEEDKTEDKLSETSSQGINLGIPSNNSSGTGKSRFALSKRRGSSVQIKIDPEVGTIKAFEKSKSTEMTSNQDSTPMGQEPKSLKSSPHTKKSSPGRKNSPRKGDPSLAFERSLSRTRTHVNPSSKLEEDVRSPKPTLDVKLLEPIKLPSETNLSPSNNDIEEERFSRIITLNSTDDPEGSDFGGSDSDEEVVELEREFSIESSNNLKNLPSESLNIMSKILMFLKADYDMKVHEDVVQNRAFAFNTELLNVERNDLIISRKTPRFMLIDYSQERKRKEIYQYLEKHLQDYLSNNKSALIIFNNFTARLSSLLPDISTLLMELQTPKQHLFLSSTSQPLYTFHMLKFSAFLLDYGVAIFNLTSKRSLTTDLHIQFQSDLAQTLAVSAKDDRRCLFIILLDAFRAGDPECSAELNKAYFNILQDINALLSGNSLQGILPNLKLKFLLTAMKKSIYKDLSESHLIYLLSQKLLANIKFVVIGEEASFRINNLKFRFNHNPQNMTFTEIFLKYFPQTFATFKPLYLNDMNLSIDKKIILNKDLFPLNLDEKLASLFQHTYNYETQFSTIFDQEYGYSILPNFRESILVADYLYKEINTTLRSKAKAQKSSGDGFSIGMKKIKKKLNEIDGEIMDMKKLNEHRQNEIEKIKQHVVDLELKMANLRKEIAEIRQEHDLLIQDLKGFQSEEETLKKLHEIYKEVTNTIITFNNKDYPEEIKQKNFFSTKIFTTYAMVWCIIFNYIPKDEKVSSDLDITGVNLCGLSYEKVVAYHKEFTRVLNDFPILKNYVLQFKFSTVTEDRLKLLIEIVKANNLHTLNVKVNKTQKNILKWMDLIIEIIKFELRKDYRSKEMKGIQKILDQRTSDLSTREKLLYQFEQVLEEQPRLQEQVIEKIRATEEQIQNTLISKNKLAKIAENIEQILRYHFELNNPVAANQELYGEYIMATSLYIVHCAKYPAQIRKHLFKLILNNMDPNLNFQKYKIHDVLFGESFLVDCLKKNVPMSLSLVDNLAIFEMLLEINLLFPMIIDPSGLFLKFIKTKMNKNLLVENFTIEGNTVRNIAMAIQEGYAICLVDFDKSLLTLIEPILNWKYGHWIDKLYKRHTAAEDKKGTFIGEEAEIVIMEEPEVLEFNGEKIKIHPDFRLILLVQNNKIALSRFLLEKVFLINNDTSSETSWKEAVSDILLTLCYKNEKENAINKYFGERLFTEVNEQFLALSEKCRKTDFAAVNLEYLTSIEKLSEEIKMKYKEKLEKRISSSPEDHKKLKRQSSTLFMRANAAERYGQDSSSPKKPIERKLERSYSSLIKDPDLANKITKGSVKTSFFFHSRSINLDEPKDAQPVPIKSLFMSGKKVEEYSNIFTAFEGIDLILDRHYQLLDYMFLLKQTLEIIENSLGDTYSFSEYTLLFNIHQAIETTILNGYLKQTGNSEAMLKFEMMVLYYLFHQLYATLRKDHQNMFSFYYAICLLKYNKEFKEEIWNLFLSGEITKGPTQSLFMDYMTEQQWTILNRFLIDYFKICDNRIPPIEPFRSETFSFLKTQHLIYDMAQEGSLFHKTINQEKFKRLSINHPYEFKDQVTADLIVKNSSSVPSKLSSFKTASSEGNTTSIPKPLITPPSKSIASRRGATNLRLTAVKIKDDDKVYSPHLASEQISRFDLPKIIGDDGNRASNLGFHSNVADVFGKNNSRGTSLFAGAKPSINIGEATPNAGSRRSSINSVAGEEEQKELMDSKKNESNASSKRSSFSRHVVEARRPSSFSDSHRASFTEKNYTPQNGTSTPLSNFFPTQPNVPEEKRKVIEKILKAFNFEGKKAGARKFSPHIVETDESRMVLHPSMIRGGKSLSSLISVIPEVDKLIKDMETNLHRWIDFINKSLINFRVPDKVFPQMPSQWNDRFTPLEIITIIKYLRPDALESYIQGFLGEIKHINYHRLSRTNLETHCRSNWYRRPTILFYGNELKNPAEVLEMLATRNKKECMKISLGETPLQVAFDVIISCSQTNKWVILENLHLLPADNLRLMIRKINNELESPYTTDSFKIWITFYMETDTYSTFWLPEDKRAIIEPFCKTCFKAFLNINDGVKSRIFDFYKLELMDFCISLENKANEIEISRKNSEEIDASPQATIKKETLSYFNIENHRIKMQNIEGKVDLYELFQKNLQKTAIEADIPDFNKQIEQENQLQIVRFLTNFIFSLLRERSKYERNLPANFGKAQLTYVGDSDLKENLNDILHFSQKNNINPFNLIEKFFCYFFNFEVNQFSSFHFVNIKYLFRTFVTNNSAGAAINVKKFTYEMLHGTIISEKEIFNCIKDFPNDDPIQLFGYNVNNDIMHSYRKSKKMFDFLIRCEESIEQKEKLENEGRELEKLILNEKYHELDVILSEYMSIKNEQKQKGLDESLSLIFLITKLITFFPPPFELRSIPAFASTLVFKKLEAEEGLLHVKRTASATIRNRSLSISSRGMNPSPKSKRISTVSTVTKAVQLFLSASKKNKEVLKSPKGKMNSLTIDTDKRPRPTSKLVLPDEIRTPTVKSTAISKSEGVSPSKSTPGSRSQFTNLFKIAIQRVVDNEEFANSDKEEDPQLAKQITNNEIFMNLLLNEVKQCNKALKRMRDDLEHALRIIKGLDHVEPSHPVYDVIQALLKNDIPDKWYEISSLPVINTDTIVDFFKIFSLKYESLKVLITDRDCRMHPVIPLSKMFDPFFLFTSMIWAHAQQNNISIHDCEIILQPIDRPPLEQKQVGGVYISGFKISGGRVNDKTYYIEDELSREFANSLPSFIAKVRKRENPLTFVDEEPSISVIIIPNFNDKSEIERAQIKDRSKYDFLPYDFKRYMDGYRVHGPDDITTDVKDNSKYWSKIYYPVRVPIIDPCFRMTKNSFNIQLYLYLKSSKPQEYWQMKGTSVLLQLDV